jgi:transcriptional regulator GlxA family with amidase domain
MTCQRKVEHRLTAFREAHPAPAHGVSPPVLSVLRAVHDGMFDPRLNVADLRTRCGISDHNISSYFKFEVGVSIKHYVEGLRLDAARALLEDAQVSVAEAALAVGYVHLQTFYSAFSRCFGVPPGELRHDRATAHAVVFDDTR